MAPAVGIDLGTTYSCVAVFINGKITIIDNEQGQSTTPSYVAFDKEKRMIGDAAKSQLVKNFKNTIYCAKRLIGKKFDELEKWPFEVVKNVDGNPEIKVEFQSRNLTLKPEEVSAMILEKMKEIAEKFLREPVTDVVITVPAYFSQEQREATKMAGTIAQLNVLEIINEPTAAALAYGMQNKTQGLQVVLVFDLGGGTFDVSIIKIVNSETFEVKAVTGDNNLGGEDFDNILVDYFADEFKRSFDVDLKTSSKAVSRLRIACEKAKRVLSSTTEASIEVDNLFENNDLCSTLTRARFDLLCHKLFIRCIELIEKALADAGMDKSEIDEVIMVGGSTRIPKIQKLVADFFGEKKINYTINPDEAIAYGAAVRAGSLTNTDGCLQNVKLLDVVPISLGISVGREGEMSIVVPKNTKLPCQLTRAFTTVYDSQVAVFIKVYEGERFLVQDNHFLGEFKLIGITPAPATKTEIEVIFNINKNGMLSVTATETGMDMVSKELKIDKKKHRWTKDEIVRMIEDKVKFTQLDEEHKQRLQARINLEEFIVNCQLAILSEKTSKELVDSERQKIREKCTEELKFLEAKNLAKNELNQRYSDLKTFMGTFKLKI